MLPLRQATGLIERLTLLKLSALSLWSILTFLQRAVTPTLNQALYFATNLGGPIDFGLAFLHRLDFLHRYYLVHLFLVAGHQTHKTFCNRL